MEIVVWLDSILIVIPGIDSLESLVAPALPGWLEMRENVGGQLNALSLALRKRFPNSKYEGGATNLVSILLDNIFPLAIFTY